MNTPVFPEYFFANDIIAANYRVANLYKNCTTKKIGNP
jgi:hypothetical protein